MKFPESWLRQHVQTDAGHDALSACLTAIGLELLIQRVREAGSNCPGRMRNSRKRGRETTSANSIRLHKGRLSIGSVAWGAEITKGHSLHT